MLAPSDRPPLPALRQDLQLHEAAPDGTGRRTWLIYDPVRHRYFQVDQQTFDLLRIWSPTDRSLFQADADRLIGRSVDDDELDELVRFATANNLTVESADGSALSYVRQVEALRQSFWLRIVHNYLFFKVPLVRPNRFLESTLPAVSFLFSPATFWFLLGVTLTGLYLVSRQWDAFVTTFLDFLTLEGMACYALTLVFVKSLHELGHAYTAARMGVRVNTMGVAFMLLFPILFTDVTDAWRLTSRKKKVAIAAAGLIVELALAGVATFLWAFLPDGPLRSVAFLVATTSWTLSLLVNLNPFMRFDGYYLLADAWGLPNAQTRGFAMAKWWLRELLFGLEADAPEDLPRRTRCWLIIYGVCTAIYRFFLFLGIALIVYHLFFKVLGVVLFAIEIFWFVLLPILKELSAWWKMRNMILKTRRTLITGTVLAAGLTAAIIPWSGTVRVPAILKAEREQQVFAPRPAKVLRVDFKDGMDVSSGDTIVSLEAPGLPHEITATRLKIDLLTSRLARIAADEKDRAEKIVLENEIRSQRERLRGLFEEQRRLTLTAPFSGTVRDTLDGLDNGDWIDTSTPIARVVSSDGLQITGYLHEDDAFRVAVDAPAVFIPEDPLLSRLEGHVRDIATTGSGTLEIPYLSSVYGGAVPSDRASDGEISARAGWFVIHAVPIAPVEHAVYGGRVVRGTLHVAGKPESLASAVWRRVLQVLVRESGI